MRESLFLESNEFANDTPAYVRHAILFVLNNEDDDGEKRNPQNSNKNHSLLCLYAFGISPTPNDSVRLQIKRMF